MKKEEFAERKRADPQHSEGRTVSEVEQKQSLYDFVVSSRGFSLKDKIKIILFASGAKRAGSVVMRINSQDLGEKFAFEKKLQKCGFVFLASKPKSYEEIEKIDGNEIKWRIVGLWVDYDLFRNKRDKNSFLAYRHLALQKQERARRSKIAGMLYSYPKCCIEQYVKETPEWIRENLSYYRLYKKLHDVDKKFPFLSHEPCTIGCKESRKLNMLYSNTTKKIAPELWGVYCRKVGYDTELIVDSESDITIHGKSIFDQKDGHEYVVVARHAFNGKHYAYNLLSKTAYARGTVLKARVTHQYNTAYIKIKSVDGVIKNLISEHEYETLKKD